MRQGRFYVLPFTLGLDNKRVLSLYKIWYQMETRGSSRSSRKCWKPGLRMPRSPTRPGLPDFPHIIARVPLLRFKTRQLGDCTTIPMTVLDPEGVSAA